MNLNYSTSPQEFAENLKINLNENYRGRFIVKAGEYLHFAPVDVSIINGKTSVIGIEPAEIKNFGPAIMLIRLSRRIKETIPDANFIMIESNVQQSPGDCAIFSLFLAKKMYKEAAFMDDLHQRNINGSLDALVNDDYIHEKNADHILPLSFMKHTTSEKRLNRYLENNEGVYSEYDKKNY